MEGEPADVCVRPWARRTQVSVGMRWTATAISFPRARLLARLRASGVVERVVAFEVDMVGDLAWGRVRAASRRDHNERASPISRSPGIAFAAEAMPAAGVRHVGEPTEAGVGTEGQMLEPRYRCRHPTATRTRPPSPVRGQGEGLGLKSAGCPGSHRHLMPVRVEQPAGHPLPLVGEPELAGEHLDDEPMLEPVP